MTMTGHQTFYNQFWCLTVQTEFDLSHLISVFTIGKEIPREISTLIISTVLLQYHPILHPNH